MPLLFPRRDPPLLFLLGAFVLASCSDAAPRSTGEPRPPAADFVLAAGDSSYWITSAGGALHLRGAPLDLARVNGRVYELYVADDDRSYEDAVLVGQRVYRRDLVTGDSLLVFQDSVVPRLASLYARLHPDDVSLGPDDEPNDDPLWSVTSTLDLDDVAGPFVSYSLHTDVERDDVAPWHTSRRGVLDLRTGGSATLTSVAGPARAQVERARDRLLTATLDSVRASNDARALAALPYYRLDAASFSLTTIDGAPAVSYAVPGVGDGDAGHLLALAPIPIGDPAWWADASMSLPVTSVDGERDVWRHGSYEVVVRYDSLSGAGMLALRDGSSREWSLGRVPAPATRILWLDHPSVDSVARRAIDRAFDEASLYDDAVRTASWRADRPAHPLVALSHESFTVPLLVRARPRTPQDPPRLRSDRRRSHDAPPGERAAPAVGVRRGDHEHGGPVRRAQRHAPRRRSVHHPVDRSHPVQGADSRR